MKIPGNEIKVGDTLVGHGKVSHIEPIDDEGWTLYVYRESDEQNVVVRCDKLYRVARFNHQLALLD